jgi:hypothetical protein
VQKINWKDSGLSSADKWFAYEPVKATLELVKLSHKSIRKQFVRHTKRYRRRSIHPLRRKCEARNAKKFFFLHNVYTYQQPKLIDFAATPATTHTVIYAMNRFIFLLSSNKETVPLKKKIKHVKHISVILYG